eukprot:TRINITY_DN1158_c0_g1_i1.p1 TRINITY_DN1158_c0_g1~~TRINITY_DN1158_c0_g1_i1.p1  ORF type:complete len:287 (+),score=44.34 TRINITY_DN1158_c0_g1_i1:237-1097(+)
MALLFRRRFIDEDGDLRPDKPRFYGVTDIKSPPLASQNLDQLQSIFESLGQFVDGLKLSGETVKILPRNLLKEITDVAHRYDINVGTGDWFEQLESNNLSSFSNYVQECKDLGFDAIDLNTKLLKIPEQTLLQLIRMVKNAKLKAKPQLGIRFERSTLPSQEDRAFGAYVVPAPPQPGWIEDVDLLIRRAERCLEAGADMILIDADGLCDRAESLRTDAVAKIIGRLGLEKTMFEAAYPETFEWFVRGYGAGVNLIVDHSHVSKLECTRCGALGFNMIPLTKKRPL